MSVGCWVPDTEGPVSTTGSRSGAGGSVKVANGTGFTQLLAESTTSSPDPSGARARAAGSATAVKLAAGRVVPRLASMGTTRPSKSSPPWPTTYMVAPSALVTMPWGESTEDTDRPVGISTPAVSWARATGT